MATNGISNLRNKDDTLPGYSIPKWNHDRDKALMYGMSKYNGGGMLDTIIKSKRLVPSPSAYNLEGTLETKHRNPITSKSPRVSTFAQVAKEAIKAHVPGVGAYNPKKKSTVLYGTSPKGSRNGLLEDAMFQGMQTPFAYTKNHKHVEPTPFSCKFSPMSK